MFITPSGKLAEKLIERGDLEALTGFEVDDSDFQALLSEAANSHPRETEEEQRDWAAYSIRAKNVLAKDTVAELGSSAAREISILANQLEAQSRGFLALKTKLDEVCEDGRATLAYLREDQSKQFAAIRDEVKEQGNLSQSAIVDSCSQASTEREELRGELANCWKRFSALWDVQYSRNRRQMILNWAWKAIVIGLLGLLAWQNAQAQVGGDFVHTNIHQYNGAAVGAGNPMHITCVSGCGGGTTDTDDGSVAGGQTGAISIALGYRWNGATWERITGEATNGIDVDVTRVQGNVSTVGTLTSNNAAPGANNVGVLPARATAADPTYTEGNQVLGSTTLAGYFRVTCNNCGGSTFADSSAFSFGVTAVSNVSFVVDDVATNAVAENSAGTPRMNANRIALSDQVNINGVAVSTGNGVAGTGVQRVAVASDNSAFTVNIGTFPDNEPFNVAQVNGVAPLMGNGITGTGSQRVTIASDNTAFTVNVGTFPANQPFNLNQIAGTAVVTGGIAGSQSVGGSVATDLPVSTENPIYMGCRSEDSVDAAPGLRVSAEGDKVPCTATRDGAQRIIIGGTQQWTYHENSSSALTDATVHASCGTGLFNYISSIVVSTGAATAFNLFVEDSTTTTILGPYYLEAIAGRGAVIPFIPAKKQTTSATLISVTTSAAIAHSIDIQGWCAE